jgi:hypothetical protein
MTSETLGVLLGSGLGKEVRPAITCTKVQAVRPTGTGSFHRNVGWNPDDLEDHTFHLADSWEDEPPHGSVRLVGPRHPKQVEKTINCNLGVRVENSRVHTRIQMLQPNEDCPDLRCIVVVLSDGQTTVGRGAEGVIAIDLDNRPVGTSRQFAARPKCAAIAEGLSTNQRGSRSRCLATARAPANLGVGWSRREVDHGVREQTGGHPRREISPSRLADGRRHESSPEFCRDGAIPPHMQPKLLLVVEVDATLTATRARIDASHEPINQAGLTRRAECEGSLNTLGEGLVVEMVV